MKIRIAGVELCTREYAKDYDTCFSGYFARIFLFATTPFWTHPTATLSLAKHDTFVSDGSHMRLRMRHGMQFCYDMFCLWFLESCCYHAKARPPGHCTPATFFDSIFLPHCRGSDPTDAVQTDVTQDANPICLAHWFFVCCLPLSSSFIFTVHCMFCGAIIQKTYFWGFPLGIYRQHSVSGWLQETALPPQTNCKRNEELIILFSILSLSSYLCLLNRCL